MRLHFATTVFLLFQNQCLATIDAEESGKHKNQHSREGRSGPNNFGKDINTPKSVVKAMDYQRSLRGRLGQETMGAVLHSVNLRPYFIIGCSRIG